MQKYVSINIYIYDYTWSFPKSWVYTQKSTKLPPFETMVTWAPQLSRFAARGVATDANLGEAKEILGAIH